MVPDARQHPLFAASPLVQGPPHIRFYACAPLVTADGLSLGTLAVMDTRSRGLSGESLQALQMLIWARYLHPVLSVQHSDSTQQQLLNRWFRQQGIALQLIPQCGTAVHFPLTTEFTS